ncbi:MAG: hypothetical protein ACE5FS_01060, partial [Paracoccaceae bacterium]
TKIALPLAAVVLVASVFLVSPPENFEGTGLVFSKADLEELRSALRVKNAVFSGRGDDGEAYEFRAELVIPDSPEPKLLTATVFTGKIDYPDGTRVTLASDTADIWLLDQRGRFDGHVVVTTSDGYVARGETATADFREGTIASNRPVVATGPLGRIDAGSFRMFQRQNPASPSGKNTVIWFENRVKLLFVPKNGG